MLGLLAEVDAVTVTADTVHWSTDRPVVEVAADAVGVRDGERAVERTRRDMVQRYVETDGCRWQLLLSYFGEGRESGCGHCDRCDEGLPVSSDEGNRPFPLEARVEHPQFSLGYVVAYEGDTVTVLFDEAGYRTLSVALTVAACWAPFQPTTTVNEVDDVLHRP